MRPSAGVPVIVCAPINNNEKKSQSEMIDWLSQIDAALPASTRELRAAAVSTGDLLRAARREIRTLQRSASGDQRAALKAGIRRLRDDGLITAADTDLLELLSAVQFRHETALSRRSRWGRRGGAGA